MAESLEAQGTPEFRRDFLKILAIATGAVGLGATLWPILDAAGPDEADTAAARLIVEVGGIAENTGISVTWNSLPIYIRKLTAGQTAANEFVPPGSLPDPAAYTDRVKPGYETFIVVVGLNTGTPCALEGNDPADSRGPYDGWLSPCDGSVYDPLGRVRSGPAKKNLAIPRYTFLNDTQLQLG